MKVRESWVDVIKGGAILLVVLHHSVAVMEATGWNSNLVNSANGVLQTVRMPLFFFASGLFFAKNLTTPWGQFLKSRVAAMLYLYVLWSAVRAAVFTPIPWVLSDADPWVEFALILVAPNTGLWFLYALALYFLALRLMHTFLPMPARIAVTALIAVLYAAGPLYTELWAWNSIVANFPYFFIAVYARHQAMELAKKSSLTVMLAAAASWVGFLAVSYALGWGFHSSSPLRVPMSLAVIVAGIILASYIDRTPLGKGFRFLGERTLPIYVLHVLVIGSVFAFWPANGAVSPVVAVVLPFTVTAVAIFIALSIWAATRKVPGLYSVPWMIRRPSTARLPKAEDLARR